MGVDLERETPVNSFEAVPLPSIVLIPDYFDITPDPQYYQPPNLLSLIGYVQKMQAEEKERIEAGEKIPDEERTVTLAGGLPYPKRLIELWEYFYISAPAEMNKEGVSAIEVLQYGGAEGNVRLRNWAAEDAKKLTGQPISSEDVLTVPSLQYGISAAILKLCARENKVLLAATPTYSAFLDAADDPIPVPVYAIESDNQGMIPDKLNDIISKLIQAGITPGLVYSIVINNPNGVIMPDERGKQINEICKKNGLPYYVDYAYYKLSRPSRSIIIPRITYLDENIILGFTSSKLASPGKRFAWEIIKSEALRQKITDTKRAQLILSAPDHEIEFWQLAESDDFESQIEKLAQIYDDGITAGLVAVNENSDIFQTDDDPGGGMFLYVKVPEGLSTYRHLGEILANHKIAYSPGRWSQPLQRKLTTTGEIIGPPPKDNYMRLCVVTESPETVKNTINRLAGIFREIAQRERIELFSKLQDDSFVQIFAG